LRNSRVGGSYWAAQPDLPEAFALVRDVEALPFARAETADPIVLWSDYGAAAVRVDTVTVRGECDPWHMLSRATVLVSKKWDEVCLVARLLGVPVRLLDAATGTWVACPTEVPALIRDSLPNGVVNPFTGEAISCREAVELCSFWRSMIDANRDIAGGVGFAFWKQNCVAPLLWSGDARGFAFLRSARGIAHGSSVAVWRAKTPANVLAALRDAKIPLVEVEDGFLRSRGLGADCIPPLSITVDRLGAHFDPTRPSELEQILQAANLDDELVARGARLRRLIVDAHLAKYERDGDGAALPRPAGSRRHILVPGQVEDDRAVVSGGCGLTSNLELLRQVREQAPDAYLIYKPHPDVQAGHRRGAIAPSDCIRFADAIAADAPISSLIEMVDEVHVITSLAGFEALLRRKRVTTYGVPFYAGWGLTTDLGPVPARRTSRRSLDELVAAVLLLYPRYLDPITGLPCPAEVLVRRLSSEGTALSTGFIVRVRRLQGQVMRRLGSVVA
jgi:capsular polysaccharide export protein